MEEKKLHPYKKSVFCENGHIHQKSAKEKTSLAYFSQRIIISTNVYPTKSFRERNVFHLVIFFASEL